MVFGDLITTNIMQYIIMGAFHCIGQACCWYNVYKCCGCIEDRPHVEIDKQQIQLQQPQQSQPSPSNPNPFLGSGVPKGPYYESAY